MKRTSIYTSVLMAGCILCSCSGHGVKETAKDGYCIITQKGGPTLGYCPNSGITIIRQDGYAFKDMNRNGKLDVYEDWRKPVEERVADLTAQLTIEDIAGLMLYSSHQTIPVTRNVYGGKSLEESGRKPWELTDEQKDFLKKDGVRHVLITSVESPETAARWNNRAQGFVEGIGFGIPCNNSSDPRHSSRADAEFNAGGGGKISMWPGSLGMCATFSPDIMKRFAEIGSIEYRALGFTTSLFPMVDVGTDPRWMRFCYTMGEGTKLATDMARAYCDGFQTSEGDAEICDGWGWNSVNTMVKHWPGTGACNEGGRDGHQGFGKYAVFPNGNFELHTLPFTEGAFRLEGKTKMSAALMPDYSACVGFEPEGVGSGFSRKFIQEMLREQQKYDGVICSDWAITHDEGGVYACQGKPWGMENRTVAERHYKVLMAGVDQFGGNNERGPVLDAYRIGVEKHGEEWMQERMRTSARRLLTNIFRTGLFENPYLDPQHTSETVGCPEFMQEGYDAQLKSVVMLKNHDSVLPLQGRRKVYIPERHVPSYTGFWGEHIEEQNITPLGSELVEKYFEQVATPQEAEAAIVFIESPNSGYGFDKEAARSGKDTGYRPISLQYGDYTATYARAQSLSGGDPYEKFTNRSYKGRSVKTVNKGDMDLVIRTRKEMGGKPVIVAINVLNPPVLSEIEPYADAIFLMFDVQRQTILDLVSGKEEPSALLPFQMPADMRTVEEQAEDTPHDMRCYKDADGNVYDYTFGMDWKGVINDSRVKKYK
ncbi:MAG: glycoside hydrolase family 3 C-terminal domain-containing protein [Bacteroidales bacterium]|nr:glycoside hydrolase family 3 C-terminal domain-containing protein [Bacteroidales bacterium]